MWGQVSITCSLFWQRNLRLWPDVAVRAVQENIELTNGKHRHVAPGDLLKGRDWSRCHRIISGGYSLIWWCLSFGQRRRLPDHEWHIKDTSGTWSVSPQKLLDFPELHDRLRRMDACVFKKTKDISGCDWVRMEQFVKGSVLPSPAGDSRKLAVCLRHAPESKETGDQSLMISALQAR